MAEQCEGCLGYKDTAEKFAVLCEECQEKAASYDITALERKRLAKAIQRALSILDVSPPSYAIGEIIGGLRTVLENCRFKVEEIDEAMVEDKEDEIRRQN